MALPMPDPNSYQQGPGGQGGWDPNGQYPQQQPWPPSQGASGSSSGKKKRPIVKGIASRKGEKNPLKWGLSIDQEWFDANQGHRALEGATELPNTNKQIKQQKVKEKALRVMANDGIDPEEKKCKIM